jgi:hypothetical protein
MPAGARLLDVQTQLAEPCLWALVDDSAPKVSRRFAVRGTGHDAVGLDSSTYVGTFQLVSGRIVFHLFDRGES